LTRARLYFTQTLNTLCELIAAGDAWDSIVNDAILILEAEEQRYLSCFLLSSPFVLLSLSTPLVQVPLLHTSASRSTLPYTPPKLNATMFDNSSLRLPPPQSSPNSPRCTHRRFRASLRSPRTLPNCRAQPHYQRIDSGYHYPHSESAPRGMALTALLRCTAAHQNNRSDGMNAIDLTSRPRTRNLV